MQLDLISLKNYRLFSEFDCSLHPELTVFVANNGGGKTSVLDGIRVALGTYLGAFPTGNGAGIKISDVRRTKTDDEIFRMTYAFPAQVRAAGKLTNEGDVIYWLRSTNTAKSGTTIKDARALSAYALSLQKADLNPQDRTIWPLLAYYGTGRLWAQKKLTSGKIRSSGFHSRAAGYIDCMEPASSYKYFEGWFGYAYRAITQAKIRYMESNPAATPAEVIEHESAYSPLVAAVREAVNIVIAPSRWKNLWYSETYQDVTAMHDEFGQLAVGQLSDGIRNSIGLAADIAFRAVQLNPHLGALAAKETPGVVLIDEVDMHLHPAWQQVILSSLREAFPRIQFIVTTHSAQVLTTVPSECIRILQNGNAFAAPPGTEGANPERMLVQVLGLKDVRPPENHATAELKEYLALVDKDEWQSNRAIALRKILDQRYQGYEPELLDADLRIENRKWEMEG